MKRKIGILILPILILSLWMVFLAYMMFYVPERTVSYMESQANPINPSRGFYSQYDSSDYEELEKLREQGITLALLAYDIHDYVEQDISGTKLEELRTALTVARENGIKIIFRAAYGFDSEYQYKDPTDIGRVIRHVEQIAPILNENRDTLLCIQAGFLGPWGEWHSSNLLPEEGTIGNRNRISLLSSLLNYLEESIKIDVRTPALIRMAQAEGLPVDRFGIHNDALLSTEDDMGTYLAKGYDRSAELAWIEGHLATGIHGGEMPQISEYSKSETADREFEKLNITYLNSMYNEEVLEDWKQDTLHSENAYEYINKHLGYRLYLSSAALPAFIKGNKKFKYEITLNNSGYAAIIRGYEACLVIKCNGDKVEYPLSDFNVNSITGGSASSCGGYFYVPVEFSANPVEIGIAIREAGGEDKSVGLTSVRLVNEGFEYIDGVNYFATYLPDGKKAYLHTEP